MLAIKLIAEGLGLGLLLYLICAAGIRNGAVGMVYLYDQKVQDRVIQLGMTTREAIRKRSSLFRGLCIPAYMAYVLICVWAINGTRGFWPGFWQSFVILSIMNLIDRFLIDDYWVGSLEKGKDADIAIFNGNPLREIQAKAVQVFVNGKPVL